MTEQGEHIFEEIADKVSGFVSQLFYTEDREKYIGQIKSIVEAIRKDEREKALNLDREKIAEYLYDKVYNRGGGGGIDWEYLDGNVSMKHTCRNKADQIIKILLGDCDG